MIDMGITIHYRGTICDLDRVTEFEDRVIDLALDVGGKAQIWRSTADDNPMRMVRGLLLDLSPGQESTSLLLSPEGWLVPLCDIESAENGTLTEQPHCFVKTQWGSVEGHVALVELLSYLKQELFPDLHVTDESGYWEHRDLDVLIAKFNQLGALIDGMADGLRKTSLTNEAAEDPHIVATRIERIARQVHATLSRPPEHPPVRFDNDEPEWSEPDWNDIDEKQWDASYKEEQRKQQRLQRAVEEQLQQGVEYREAFENALRDEGIIDLPGEDDEKLAKDRWVESETGESHEAWRESLDSPYEIEGDPFDNEERDDPPLLKLATNFYLRLIELFKGNLESPSSHLDTLMRGAGDICGGLAQALAKDFEAEGLWRGIALVQLKRSLRGAAFANGALFPLRAERVLDDDSFEELRTLLKQLEDSIFQELQRVRNHQVD
jgi:hypothetical protein